MRTLAAFSCAPLIGGCVTTRTFPGRNQPAPPVVASDPAAPPSANPNDSPVAASNTQGPASAVDPAAPANPRSAQARFEVLPLGDISYDGMTLPLISPDGAFIAVQTGSPPTWDALAAARPMIVDGSRIEVFDIGNRAIRSVAWSTAAIAALPPGLMLGRAVDTEGFFVELPRTDGSRWLGKLNWRTGELRWIVGGDAERFSFALHAVISPAGAIVYASRDQLGADLAIATITPDGKQLTMNVAPAQWLCPLAPIDESRIAMLHLDAAGSLTMKIISRTPSASPSSTAASPSTFAKASEIATTAIASPATPAQAMLCLLSMPPSGAIAPVGSSVYPLLHLWRGRVVLFSTNGVSIELPEGSMAAAIGPNQLMLTMPKALLFHNLPNNWAGTGLGAAVSALVQPGLPRAFSPVSGWVVVGPGSGENRLRIVKMAKLD